MKFEEKIAMKYFELKNFNSIIFEPIGNTPPDFVLNNSIAVEVRRLNRFHNGVPYEELEYNVVPKITNFINSYSNNKYYDTTSLVSIFYSRPLKFNNSIKSKIAYALNSFSQFSHTKNEYFINDNLTITVYAISEKWSNQFEVGAFFDRDSTGTIFQPLCNSLEIIIKEKEDKIEKFKDLYSDWWLVLIDFISYGISENMLKRIQNDIDSNILFKKIIFISPMDIKNTKEINYT